MQERGRERGREKDHTLRGAQSRLRVCEERKYMVRRREVERSARRGKRIRAREQRKREREKRKRGVLSLSLTVSGNTMQHNASEQATL